ncbi:hypothetical protein ACW180_01135 [Limosilactobacillus fermentum]
MGQTEAQLKKVGKEYKVLKMPRRGVPKALGN